MLAGYYGTIGFIILLLLLGALMFYYYQGSVKILSSSSSTLEILIILLVFIVLFQALEYLVVKSSSWSSLVPLSTTTDAVMIADQQQEGGQHCPLPLANLITGENQVNVPPVKVCYEVPRSICKNDMQTALNNIVQGNVSLFINLVISELKLHLKDAESQQKLYQIMSIFQSRTGHDWKDLYNDPEVRAAMYNMINLVSTNINNSESLKIFNGLLNEINMQMGYMLTEKLDSSLKEKLPVINDIINQANLTNPPLSRCSPPISSSASPTYLPTPPPSSCPPSVSPNCPPPVSPSCPPPVPPQCTIPYGSSWISHPQDNNYLVNTSSGTIVPVVKTAGNGGMIPSNNNNNPAFGSGSGQVYVPNGHPGSNITYLPDINGSGSGQVYVPTGPPGSNITYLPDINGSIGSGSGVIVPTPNGPRSGWGSGTLPANNNLGGPRFGSGVIESTPNGPRSGWGSGTLPANNNLGGPPRFGSGVIESTPNGSPRSGWGSGTLPANNNLGGPPRFGSGGGTIESTPNGIPRSGWGSGTLPVNNNNLGGPRFGSGSGEIVNNGTTTGTNSMTKSSSSSVTKSSNSSITSSSSSASSGNNVTKSGNNGNITSRVNYTPPARVSYPQSSQLEIPIGEIVNSPSNVNLPKLGTVLINTPYSIKIRSIPNTIVLYIPDERNGVIHIGRIVDSVGFEFFYNYPFDLSQNGVYQLVVSSSYAIFVIIQNGTMVATYDTIGSPLNNNDNNNGFNSSINTTYLSNITPVLLTNASTYNLEPKNEAMISTVPNQPIWYIYYTRGIPNTVSIANYSGAPIGQYDIIEEFEVNMGRNESYVSNVPIIPGVTDREFEITVTVNNGLVSGTSSLG